MIRIHQAGPEGGDNGGAGPEPVRVLPGAVRGGDPLLLGAVRLAGRELRRGQPRAARRGAAAAVAGDPQRARRRRARPHGRRQVRRQLAGEAGAVRVPRRLARRRRRRAGVAAARHVPLRWVHARGGERRAQARVEGSLPAHRLSLAPDSSAGPVPLKVEKILLQS